VLNPQGPYYQIIKNNLSAEYEDNYWMEDVIFMERNSRDFGSRIERINTNAEAICDVLRASSDGKAARESCCWHLLKYLCSQTSVLP